ncbi:MAG: nuclear transport factor 2 family protein [Geothrix sp.]|nr:nuclear transport factor 2 family protein [Geothrix sp.]
MRRILMACLPIPVLVAAAPSVPGPEVVVQRQIEAFNAHDLEAFLATFGEDLEMAALPGGPGSSSGKARLRELYGERFRRNPDLRATVLDRMVSGTFVIQRERISGRAGKAPLEATVIYQVKAGAIRRMWTLGD